MNLIKNKNGFSLVQVLMSAVMIAGLSMLAAKLTQNSNKGIAKARGASELLEFERILKSNLSNAGKCRETFFTPGLDFGNEGQASLIDHVDADDPPFPDDVGNNFNGTRPKYFRYSGNGTDIPNFDIITNIAPPRSLTLTGDE